MLMSPSSKNPPKIHCHLVCFTDLNIPFLLQAAMLRAIYVEQRMLPGKA